MRGIDKPGLYPDLPADEYHADCCANVSISSGLLKVILTESLAHARLCHPRLTPDFKREEKRSFDLGHVAHQLILGDTNTIRVIDPKRFPAKNGNIPNGWTNDAIREARDAAYEDGKIPLLPWEHEQALAMQDAVGHQLLAAKTAAFLMGAGKPEQSLIWQEDGVWCRARLDWHPDSGNIFHDLKTTDGSANPESWAARHMFAIGADIQAAFYRRGIRAVLGIQEPVFRFVVAEQNPPYAISIVEPSPRAYELADHKVNHALALWKQALATNNWPAYPLAAYCADPPAWAEVAWMNKMVAEEGK